MAAITARRRRIGPDESSAVRRHRPDYRLALFMGLIMMIGLVVMFAIGPQRARVLNTLNGADISDSYFFTRQAINLTVAVVVFAIASFISFEWVQKHSGKLLLVAIGSCLLLAFADLIGWGIAQETLGATRWFNFGFVSMQPSEFLKFGLLVFLAVFLGKRMKDGEQNDLHKTLIPFGVVAVAAITLVVIFQKDMGTGIALVAIMFTMLFAAQVRLKTLGIILAGLVVMMLLLIATAPHRMARMMTFAAGDDISVADAGGYHIANAKIAIGSGGMFGAGIGNSVQATGYLPEAINDSVFAIMGETFGFIGLVVVVLLFGALLLRLAHLVDRLPDYRMRLLAAGVFGWLASHVFINIAAMIGLAPLTGITLPLLSYGGTSMVFIAAALGLAFQVSRYTSHQSSSKLRETRYANPSSRRRVGRSRYASSSSSTRA